LLQFDDEYNLIDCTAEIASRYKLGYRGYSALLNSFCAGGGADLDTITGLGRESVRKKKFKKIQERGKIYLTMYLSML
jgi:hypothetical protein